MTSGHRSSLAVAAFAAAAFCVLGICVLGLGIAGCAPPQSGRSANVFSGPAMGTSYSVKVVSSSPLSREQQGEIRQTISAELDRINARMSTYLADSEISRFNAHGAETPFAVSAETGEVVAAALAVGQATGGAFDITIAPLVDAWGFGPTLETPPELPQKRIDEILVEIGIDKVSVGEDRRTLTKHHEDVSIDLSGIAKGYAVDRLAEALIEQGFTDLLVDIGGEVRAAGRNADGEPWRLGIERPQDAMPMRGQIQLVVPLEDLAMATSGDYRNYREVDGVRFSHLLDPRIGRPIRHRLSSVSVVHPQCMVADAWATALIVLGPEEGLKLAAERGLAAYFLIRDDQGGFVQESTQEFDRLRGVLSPETN